MEWPYTSVPHNGFKCAICGKLVGLDYIADQYGRTIYYYPVSLYWNASKQDVYCGTEHSLEGHSNEQNH